MGLREEGGEECGVEGLLPTSKSITKVSKPVYTICIHVCKHTLEQDNNSEQALNITITITICISPSS